MSVVRALAVRPLTRAGFERFGDVIETEDSTSFAINDGSAMRFNDLAQVDVSMHNGRAALSVFRGQPVRFPLRLSALDRAGPGENCDVAGLAADYVIESVGI